MLKAKAILILIVILACPQVLRADDDILVNNGSGSVGTLTFGGGAMVAPGRDPQKPSQPSVNPPSGDSMAEGDNPLSQDDGSNSFGSDDVTSDIIDLVGG